MFTINGFDKCDQISMFVNSISKNILNILNEMRVKKMTIPIKEVRNTDTIYCLLLHIVYLYRQI